MGNPLRWGARSVLRAGTAAWPPHRRLFLIEDRDSWVIHWEMEQLRQHARRLGVQTASPFWMPFSRDQAVFYGSQFFLLNGDWRDRPHRIGTAYFHGKPGTGVPEFDQLYHQIEKHHERVDRLQVSHSEMEALILETGIAPEKVHRIPIGVDLNLFPQVTPQSREKQRQVLGLPPDAFVVGSFLKDGEGWGEGNAPKLIKGPDIFVEVMQRVKSAIPSLHVLLTGPARGFVKQGLAQAGVPFTHHQFDAYTDIPGGYQALDAMLVTSRQEGGPKAVLESMASGIQLVTTRVGQAMDLVQDGVNAWMTGVEDVEGLSERLIQVFRSPEDPSGMVSEGRKTAERFDYPQLDASWAKLFDGFVEARP